MIPLSSDRPRVNDELVRQVIRGLTDRDRSICLLLEQHRVLTTNQISKAFFNSDKRARFRMTMLYKRRLVERFRPFRETGSHPFHYMLDVIGQTVCNAEHGDVAPNTYTADVLRWQRSQQLNHLVAVNDFFTSLMAAARRPQSNSALLEWWSEARCAKAMAGLVRPDGYGVWEENGRRVEFCLEVDRGTETIARVAAKLEDYKKLQAATGVERWVLFWLPTQRREASLRQAIIRTSLPVATAVAGGSPESKVWLKVGERMYRERLTELNR